MAADRQRIRHLARDHLFGALFRKNDNLFNRLDASSELRIQRAPDEERLRTEKLQDSRRFQAAVRPGSQCELTFRSGHFQIRSSLSLIRLVFNEKKF